MRLVPITEEDRELTHRLEGDERMMVHFGGPRTNEQIDDVHTRRLGLMANNEAWMYKILPDDSDEPLGSIGYWKQEHDGQSVHEMGWMVLPEAQGKGVATAAGKLLLELARANPEVKVMFACPAESNGPSNAICEKLGFERVGEEDAEWSGRQLHLIDYELKLRD